MIVNDSDLKLYLKPYFNEIFARKSENIAVLDVRKFTSYTDIIIVLTASSAKQVSSIAENIHANMKKSGIMPLGVEGVEEGKWALLDFGDVIIHVFDKETKDFYDIEGFWSDAPRVDISEFNK